jgi:hypothetical protein
MGISRIAVPLARMYASAIFATASGLDTAGTALPLDILVYFAGGVHALLIALVQIQLRIQFRLTHQQLLEPIVMLERAIGLRLEIRKLFLCACDAALLL